jgi:hypothetical protein
MCGMIDTHEMVLSSKGSSHISIICRVATDSNNLALATCKGSPIIIASSYDTVAA